MTYLFGHHERRVVDAGIEGAVHEPDEACTRGDAQH